MDFAGRYVIPARPAIVWAAINDPEVLKGCIPGCQSMEKTDPTHFEAAVRLKIGPVSATFKGKVALEELDEPRRCVLKGEGQGGVAGFARGEAEVLLEEGEGGTILTYNLKANVGGKLAQIGQRLIDGAARQIADDFFAKFAAAAAAADAADRAQMQTEAIALAEAEAAGVPVEPFAAQANLGDIPAVVPVRREGMAPEIWVVGLIAVIVILLVLFGVVL
jgi:carbon monoxide dehydrogenase subunit G